MSPDLCGHVNKWRNKWINFLVITVAMYYDDDDSMSGNDSGDCKRCRRRHTVHSGQLQRLCIFTTSWRYINPITIIIRCVHREVANFRRPRSTVEGHQDQWPEGNNFSRMCPDDYDELLHSSPTRIQTVETPSHLTSEYSSTFDMSPRHATSRLRYGNLSLFLWFISTYNSIHIVALFFHDRARSLA